MVLDSHISSQSVYGWFQTIVRVLSDGISFVFLAVLQCIVKQDK